MSNSESLAHTRRDCAYHIVRMPKYGRRVLCGEARQEVGDVLRRLVDAKYGIELVGGAVARDHMHMCLGMAPKHGVAKVTGCLRGKSALVLFGHRPERRPGTGRDRTFWARGYYVSTVGLSEAAIRKCVRNQEDASRINGWACRGPRLCRDRSIAARAANKKPPATPVVSYLMALGLAPLAIFYSIS